MNQANFFFDNEQFNRLFPFYLLLDHQLRIISIGKSLKKINPVIKMDQFNDFFKIKRPDIAIEKSDDLKPLINQLIILEFKSKKDLLLRGQIEYLAAENHFLFIGTPWFDSVDKVKDSNLTLHDFAISDPMIDLLHVLKTQEITISEIKFLLKTLGIQKNKLIQSEAKYRTIIEKATDIIFKANREGRFTFVNDVAERITGYPKEELLNMGYSELIREDYRERAAEFYTNQVLSNTPTTYYEFPIVTKRGKEIWIGQSVQARQVNNVTVELTALAMDISEKKNAEQNLKVQEEKYRNIIANMNLGLLEVDLNDVIQYANQSFCNISGYSLDDLVGHKASNLLINESERHLITQKNEDRTKGISDMYTVPVRNKKGELRWWVISGAPRYNDNGDLVGSVGIHLDITEQKRLEEELKKAKFKAEDSSRAKESFLATMSHEIRTPLNAIVGITDLINLNAEANTKENLEILSFSAKNLLALITDILDISKIDAGKIELAKNSFNLKKLLSGIQQMFRQTCEEKQIELILDIGNNVPEFIKGDELRLSQILNNLIGNAVKFTSKGSVSIQVSSGMQVNNFTQLKFQISDTGIGIAKEKLKNIFEAFQQADKNISQKYGGTGLGLAITKKLIELQGGKINVTSKLHKGSVFSFEFNAEITTESQIVSRQSEDSSASDFIPSSDYTLLLVEDNLVNQKVAISYLDFWGFKWDVANNGSEALEMLHKKKYDLALIDLFMPVKDGFETIKQIRKSNGFKNMPIIALTASAEVSLMEKAISLGAEKCLTKPFNALQLHETILNLLNKEKVTQSSEQEIKSEIPAPMKYKFINLKNLLDASLGSNPFIKDMLEILCREIPLMINDANQKITSDDFHAFSSIIHRMKNNMLTLGLEMLREDLRFAEENSRKGENKEQVIQAYTRIKSVWENAKPELDQAKEQYQ